MYFVPIISFFLLILYFLRTDIFQKDLSGLSWHYPGGNTDRNLTFSPRINKNRELRLTPSRLSRDHQEYPWNSMEDNEYITMKILHTSDWHLGRSLYGKKRYEDMLKDYLEINEGIKRILKS